MRRSPRAWAVRPRPREDEWGPLAPRPAPSSSEVGRGSGRLLSRSFSPGACSPVTADRTVAVRRARMGSSSGDSHLPWRWAQGCTAAPGAPARSTADAAVPQVGACVLSPLPRLSGKVALLSCLHHVVARGARAQGHRLLQMAFQVSSPAAGILEGREVGGVGGVLQQEADPFPAAVPTREPGAWGSAGPAHEVTPNAVRFPELPRAEPLAAPIRVRGSSPWR